MQQQWSVYNGDVLEAMQGVEDNEVDAVLCDPPYGLSEHPDMMEVLRCWVDGKAYTHGKKGVLGKTWDSFVPGPEVWKEIYRALKPGGFALVFAGTRTFDLMGLALRLSGFEIRDTVMWVYGSGFPKSLDISRAMDKAVMAEREIVGTKVNTYDARTWEGYGTALKPAWEPCIIAMKPLDGTFIQNAVTHGVAGLHIDAGRISTSDKLGGGENSAATRRTGKTEGWTRPWMEDAEATAKCAKRSLEATAKAEALGRWPANVIMDEEAGAALDIQSGITKSSGGANGGKLGNRILGKFKNETLSKNAGGLGDIRGASRFFYCPKVDRKERESGMENADMKILARSNAAKRMETDGDNQDRAETSNGPNTTPNVVNNHPTLKPIDLTRYLASLILPPPRQDNEPRKLLVPFSGAGSEMIGALQAGWDFVVGIEGEADYCDISRLRLAHWCPEALGDEGGVEEESPVA
jgi:site-specific DNA-methyltransferase (adenine-specific)